MRVTNLAEAQAAVKALSEFLGRFESTLQVLETLKGLPVDMAVPKTAHRALDVSPAPLHTNASAGEPNNDNPGSMNDRVLKLIREAGTPVSPVEIEAMYRNKGWPEPASGKLRTVLLSSAYYLAEKRHLLERSHGKYWLKKQESLAPH